MSMLFLREPLPSCKYFIVTVSGLFQLIVLRTTCYGAVNWKKNVA